MAASLQTFPCITYNHSIIRSELIWALYVVSQNLSYSSCDNIKATLKVKFPGIIPETFSTNSSKIQSSWLWFQFSEVASGGFLLKRFANLTGKYLSWSLSLIKFISCEYCEIFTNTYFDEHLRMTTYKYSECWRFEKKQLIAHYSLWKNNQQIGDKTARH